MEPPTITSLTITQGDVRILNELLHSPVSIKTTNRSTFSSKCQNFIDTTQEEELRLQSPLLHANSHHIGYIINTIDHLHTPQSSSVNQPVIETQPWPEGADDVYQRRSQSTSFDFFGTNKFPVNLPKILNYLPDPALQTPKSYIQQERSPTYATQVRVSKKQNSLGEDAHSNIPQQDIANTFQQRPLNYIVSRLPTSKKLKSSQDHQVDEDSQLPCKKPPRTCKFSQCMKTIQRNGLCHKHGGIRRCIHEGCTRKDRGEGYCVTHGGGKRCAVGGCNKVVRRGSFCMHHSQQAEHSFHSITKVA